MANATLSKKHFRDEAAAFAYVEARLWPSGPVCPFCGATEEHIGQLKGKGARIGLRKCYGCRKTFTVRIGTIFESSHLPLHLWLQVMHLMSASKKDISTRQVQRMLQCSMKTAWFLSHRIREAMAEGELNPFGSTGGVVEVDETFIGRKKGEKVRYGYEHKNKVLSLVDRDSGKARSIVLDQLNTKTVAPIVRANVAKEARLMTDEAKHYVKVGREFADHQRLYHGDGEYGRGEAHTNTIEGYFSIFKRGMKGIYQHCSEDHLHRYMAEFDFRYSNREGLGVDDVSRADMALQGVKGKRLTYETTRHQA